MAHSSGDRIGASFLIQELVGWLMIWKGFHGNSKGEEKTGHAEPECHDKRVSWPFMILLHVLLSTNMYF